LKQVNQKALFYFFLNFLAKKTGKTHLYPLYTSKYYHGHHEYPLTLVLYMKKNILFYFALLLIGLFGFQRSFAQLTATSYRPSPPTKVFNDATISVAALLHNLEAIHKVNFVYQQGLVEGKTVPLPVNENDKIENTLNRVLPPLNLSFKKLRGGNAYTVSYTHLTLPTKP
jgi:hypothetical protein